MIHRRTFNLLKPASGMVQLVLLVALFILAVAATLVSAAPISEVFLFTPLFSDTYPEAISPT